MHISDDDDEIEIIHNNNNISKLFDKDNFYVSSQNNDDICGLILQNGGVIKEDLSSKINYIIINDANDFDDDDIIHKSINEILLILPYHYIRICIKLNKKLNAEYFYVHHHNELERTIQRQKVSTPSNLQLQPQRKKKKKLFLNSVYNKKLKKVMKNKILMLYMNIKRNVMNYIQNYYIIIEITIYHKKYRKK